MSTNAGYAGNTESIESATIAVEPYRVRFSDDDVADLRARLASTRWPAEPAGVGADQGMPVEVVKEWAERWRDGFDFAAAQERLNRFPQFTAEIDGQRVHFWHVRATAGAPRAATRALLLLHGWPSSVLELEKVVGPLTDPAAHGAPEGTAAYDVVVPSLPGYGFSGPTADGGWDSARMAAALSALMSGLGYEAWGVAGGDAGSLVAREAGVLAPAGLTGVHVLQWFSFPSGDAAEAERFSDADRDSLSGTLADYEARSGYADIQQKRPGTLAFALDDSAAGVLAWNAELWTAFGERPGDVVVDDYLTHVSTYWFTRTSGSSARHYFNDRASGAGYRELPVEVPVAVAVFPFDFRSIRVLVERSAKNLARYTEMPHGGHFAYVTDPELLIEDLRAFFGTL